MSYVLHVIPKNEEKSIENYFTSVSFAKFDSTMQSHMHAHPHTELFYISKGKGILSTQNQEIEIAKGDAVIINSNTMHTEKCFNKDLLEYYIVALSGVTFTSSPSSIPGKNNASKDSELDLVNTEKEFDNIHLVSLKERESETINCFKEIFNEFENKGEYYKSIILNNLSNFVISILRALKLVTAPDNFISFKGQYTNCSFIKQYIDTNFSIQLTLDDLANKAYLSKGYLIRSFNKCYGISPMEYLKTKRIDCAKNLLQTTKLSIAQITTNIGFSNQSHFAQAFKEIVGISPKSFREQYQV